MRWQQLVSTAPVSDTIYDRVFDRPYPVYEPEEDEPAESAPFMVRFDMPEKSSSLHAYHVQQAAFLHVNMYINGMHSEGNNREEEPRLIASDRYHQSPLPDQDEGALRKGETACREDGWYVSTGASDRSGVHRGLVRYFRSHTSRRIESRNGG